MKFSFEQHFPAPADAVLALYSSEHFYKELRNLPKIGEPVVLTREVGPGVVTLRVRHRFTGDVPRAARSVIDRTRLTWVDETVYDLSARRSTTRFLPDHYPDRLEAAATATYEGSSSGSMRRIVGELRVHLSILSSKVERAIVSGIEAHLSEEARVADCCLAR
ncbi:MAG: DUF2505 domain-containing protein [Acidimicrobiales bacterium]|nr:DUF2505 domain-containing protein [Acidimicrobiales bacterium]